MSWKLDDVQSLSGKTIIVTGGSSGLGFEAVKMFVSKDATVIMATRSEQRALDAISNIKTEYPNAKVKFIELNLGSKASIKQCRCNDNTVLTNRRWLRIPTRNQPFRALLLDCIIIQDYQKYTKCTNC